MSVLIAAVLASALQQPAEPPKSPWRKFEFTVGAMISDLSSSVEVTTGSGVGGVVDLERALGMEESLTQVRAGMSWEISPGHRLWLDYVNLSRTARRTLSAEIEFDGVTYPVGTSVATDFDLELINLVYGYSVIRDERVDLALTFGIHALETKIELQGESVGTESESFILPIPLPGMRMNILLAKDFYFKQTLEFLWLRFDNFEGLMADVQVGFEWAAFKHLAFGIAYSHLQIALEMEDANFPSVEFEGRFEFDVSGLLLYTTLYF